MGDGVNKQQIFKHKYWTARNKLAKLLGNKFLYQKIIDKIRLKGAGVRSKLLNKNFNKICHLRSKYGVCSEDSALPERYGEI